MKLIPDEWYKRPLVRAVMRAVRVAAAAALSAFVGSLLEAPETVKHGLTVFLVALDKYLRDRTVY